MHIADQNQREPIQLVELLYNYEVVERVCFSDVINKHDAKVNFKTWMIHRPFENVIIDCVLHFCDSASRFRSSLCLIFIYIPYILKTKIYFLMFQLLAHVIMLHVPEYKSLGCNLTFLRSYSQAWHC